MFENELLLVYFFENRCFIINKLSRRRCLLLGSVSGDFLLEMIDYVTYEEMDKIRKGDKNGIPKLY